MDERENRTIATPEMHCAARAAVMVFAVPSVIMAMTVRPRLMRVICLRPSRSESLPTKGAMAPTAIICALSSQTEYDEASKSKAITVNRVIKNNGITSATMKVMLKPNMVIMKRKLTCKVRLCGIV